MMRMVVDFPAPLGPRKPVTRPGCAVKLTSVDGGEVTVGPGDLLDGDHRASTMSAVMAEGLKPFTIR